MQKRNGEFGIPFRRRHWTSMLSLLLLVAAAGAIGCGGGAGGGGLKHRLTAHLEVRWLRRANWWGLCGAIGCLSKASTRYFRRNST